MIGISPRPGKFVHYAVHKVEWENGSLPMPSARIGHFKAGGTSPKRSTQRFAKQSQTILRIVSRMAAHLRRFCLKRIHGPLSHLLLLPSSSLIAERAARLAQCVLM